MPDRPTSDRPTSDRQTSDRQKSAPPEPDAPDPLDEAREDVEFLRAMREMEVRPKPAKRPSHVAPRKGGATEPTVARRFLEHEDDVFERSMASLFGAGVETKPGAPPEVESRDDVGPRDDVGAPPSPSPSALDPADDDLFEREMAAFFSGEATSVASPAPGDVRSGDRLRGPHEPGEAPAEPDAEPVELLPKNPLLHGSTKALARRLRKEEIAPEAEVDLHRLTRNEAINRLDAFLKDSVRIGREIVLVITGRGLHSVDLGVLREMIPVLLRRRWPGIVRECLPAPRHLGGEGACVVFLRRTAG